MAADPTTKILDERIDERLKARERDLERLRAGNGGTTSGGGMDPWHHSVENRLSEVRVDIRALDTKVDRNFIITWGGIIVGALGILAIIGRVFAII